MKRTLLAIFIGLSFSAVPWLHAQDAHALIQQAVEAELRASHDDHSCWRYRDDERDKGVVSIVVQTDAGSVKRPILRNGQPIPPAQAQIDEQHIQTFLHDPAAVAKQRRDGASDGKSATAFLKMLPDAFVWKVSGETPRDITLHFQPNPNFNAPDMQARVLGVMAGEVIVNKEQHRIATIRGTLTQDVAIGFGLLGRIRQGGTFDVERREVGPGLWQITETHVHIEGKALFFKSIGQQQDEIQTEFTRVPGSTTLEQAAEMSKPSK